ncbi:MAG: SUMF1/EgtB/PvdO family nonheme iron enzyme [Myxococcales bacterium]|nr:SUMF1/EgtB/PvdO family nonheme iron enzyme [Myxococcales bacterium]
MDDVSHSDAPSTPPNRLLSAGTQLGPYVVGKLLGEGGMSAVYAAWDEALERHVAVKVLHPNLVGDSGIRRRFLREGRITRGWAHPNVVPVLDTVTEGDTIALVMERVDAPTLADFLKRWRGGLPPRECGELAVGILSGLEAAHARGVVHRDLKPGNVLVDAVQGRLWPRIIDFGIARVLEGTTYTLTGAVMGTCRYMSPEQVRGESVDYQSDLYTFGVLLYELFTGAPPFDDAQPYALMMAHTSREPEPPSVVRPGLHPGVQEAILRCLAKRPEDRPTGAAEVRDRLMDSLGVALAVSEPRVGHNPNDHELVQVDAGTFLMGPDRRRVHVDAFGLDRHPVTNGQFHAFLSATGYEPDDPHRFVAHWPSTKGPSPSQREHPVVFVSHADAQAYAGWLGLRLPTEAEWEKAARGVDGRRYPWGRAAPTTERAWFGQRTGTSPVGRRPEGVSPWGIHDLAGNVWEWCADADDPAFYASGPDINPRRLPGLEAEPMVVRGGGWMFDDGKALRTWTRASHLPDRRLDTLGFRCAG